MSVVLLHDLGDAHGGAAWRAAAPPDWIVPDLPGHGATPAVRSGHCDPMSVVAVARWSIADATDATVVGVHRNAHAALVHAAGGGCSRVVVIDGLWGPWRTPEEEVDALYAMIRSVAEDRAATAPAPRSGLDPRTAHGYGLMGGANFARRFWGAIAMPVLAIETPASSTPASERHERLSWFAGSCDLVELDTSEPTAVVDAITTWM